MSSRLGRCEGAGVLLAGLALALGSGGAAGAEEPLKVVVHVNFEDAARQGRGLKNVENILKAADAAGVPTEVEVVCHANGIDLLVKGKTAQADLVASLRGKGVRFAACENTMRQRSIRREDLLGGVTTVPSGAFEVVRRQRDGYTYFKP